MNIRVKKITPQLAQEYLERNHSQRPISRADVEKYKRQLRTSTFFTTHQGIAFDEQDRLRDGQNRLTAIVETGISAEMPVATGLSEEAIQAIDDGRRRTDSQALTMFVGEPVSSFVTAIAREMYSGGAHPKDGARRRKLTRLDLIAFYDKYRGQIAYAAQQFRNHDTGMALGFVAAVVARAAVDHSGRKLDHFAKVLAEGFTTKEEDQIIIRLRNHILQQRRAQKHGRAQRDALYAKTERVLKAYLDREELSSVQAAKEELFPLEEDVQPRGDGADGKA
jgi:hypothetical protein